MLDKPIGARTRDLQPEPVQPASEYIRPGDIAAFTRGNIGLIGACAAIGLGLAGAYVWLAEPIYTARAQMIIAPKAPPLLRDQPGEVVFSLDNAQVESQIAVLRSESTISTVVKKLGLLKDPEFSEPRPTVLGGALALVRGPAPQPSEFERQRMTISAFESGLDVRRVGLSYVIEISFNSRDPEKAATVANAMAASYIDEQIESRLESAKQGSSWLETRIGELRIQLNDAVQKVQKLKGSHDYRIAASDEGSAPKRTLDELESTVLAYRKLYETFLQSYSESVQRQSAPTSDARVITPATRPLANTYPRTKPILGMGMLIGAMAGFLLALSRDSRRRASA